MKQIRFLSGLLILLAGALGLSGNPVLAQEKIKWRKNYAEARKEAETRGLPLILDFYTVPCFWCDKLDQATFSDPTVARTINEKFIPLKIDGNAEPQLAQALRISAYPTIVLADPDGKIVGTIEGFKDAQRFHEYLQRALAAVTNPEWMRKDFEEATKAVSTSDYAKAVALLKNVLQSDKGRPIQVKARQLLNDIEQQAAGLLARARQHNDKGQIAEATDVLTKLIRTYPGTQPADEAGQMITQLASSPQIRTKQRQQRARELLAQAKEDYRTKQYICCLDRCEILSSGYGDLEEGVEAMQLAAEIRSNPEWMQAACDNLSERLSNMYLALAETWLKKGQPRQAEVCLQRVIQTFPNSRHAEIAQVRLGQLQGTTTRTVDFQKR